MWGILFRGIQIVGAAAIGYVSNDFITWLGKLPIVGSFFSKQDPNNPGQPAPIVQVVTIVLSIAAFYFILTKLFKIKIK